MKVLAFIKKFGILVDIDVKMSICRNQAVALALTLMNPCQTLIHMLTPECEDSKYFNL